MQVRKRPLNKKEIAKKEGDIITIDPNANSLTVYETKLKVSFCWLVFAIAIFLHKFTCSDVSLPLVNAAVFSILVPGILVTSFGRLT